MRERQDMVGEWQRRDRLLIAARSAPSDKRNNVAEEALAARLTAIDARIAEIDRTLARNFPDYATLANPEPLEISEVQAQLRADEALVPFLVTGEQRPAPEETFLGLSPRPTTAGRELRPVPTTTSSPFAADWIADGGKVR